MPQERNTAPSQPVLISGYRTANPATVNSFTAGALVKNQGAVKMETANPVLMP